MSVPPRSSKTDAFVGYEKLLGWTVFKNPHFNPFQSSSVVPIRGICCICLWLPNMAEFRDTAQICCSCVDRLTVLHTAISRKVVGKMCTRQSRKVIYDVLNKLFLTLGHTVAVEFFCCFPQAFANIVYGLSCHSFKFLWRTVNLKPPTIPLNMGLSHALFGTTFLQIAVLYDGQKRNPTDTRTCFVPFDCSSILSSLGIFKLNPKR